MPKSTWAMPSKIRIKSTSQIGRLYMIYYDYDDAGNDLLVLQLDNGNFVKVLSTDAEHASEPVKAQL